MTVVRRRRPRPEPPAVRRRGRGPAPLANRFPTGLRVQVYDDVSDNRFAGRFGEVVAVHEERDDIYPHGRVEVLLAIDRLYATFFKRPRGPNPVTFKPNDLDRSPE